VIEYENKGIGQGLAMLLPMLIVMFLFSGAMSIGPDSIAGEKERGTIATLLITPVKRSEIAIGKVFSLSVISLFSATSSFVGIMFSLDNLIGNNDINSFEIYGINEFLMLFVVILSTVFVIVGLISVISAYAKTIKEASTLILPFYFSSVVIGISTMFSGEASASLVSYLIPIYNSVNMIIAILTFEVNALHFAINVGANVVYLAIFIFILNRLFQSEKLMFSK
jgi:sodium transport system permease protein